ncbi:MAG: hypothetical protein AAFQ74_07360 [Cyanobacteria bacterium J06623_4]
MWSTRYPNRYRQSLPPYALAQPSTTPAARTHRARMRPRRKSASWQRPLLSAGIAALIGGTGVWLTEALIAPQASQAYTSRLDLFIARESGETYETLLRRAEMAARAGAQRSFDQDLLTTNVSVNVVVESSGITVPILSLRVDRDQWRARPETYYWATYYRTAETLLGTASPGLLEF